MALTEIGQTDPTESAENNASHPSQRRNFILTLVLLNLDLSLFENTVHQDQLASNEAF